MKKKNTLAIVFILATISGVLVGISVKDIPLSLGVAMGTMSGLLLLLAPLLVDDNRY